MTIPIFDLGFGPLQSKKILRAAEMADLYQTLRTGDYFDPWPYVYSSTPAIVVNTLYAVPCFVARPITIDRLAINLAGAGVAGALRLGICNNGTNNYPGTLLLDAGTVDPASATFQAITISQALATKGIYWFVLVANSAPAPRSGILIASPLGNLSTSGYDPYNRWQVAFTYAALPDPFPAGGTQSTSAAFLILARMLSLD